MSRRVFVGSVLALGVLAAGAAGAQSKCSGNVVLAGKRVQMDHCAVAYFEDQHGIALWFDEQPIPAAKAASFQESAYASEPGHRMLQVMFCPAGKGASPDAKAVPFVGIDINDGPSWVFQLDKDHDVKVERMAGKLAPGGKLAGRITGQRQSDGQPYSFDLDFDLALPSKSSLAGPDCGAGS
jgi:hypothetical protein